MTAAVLALRKPGSWSGLCYWRRLAGCVFIQPYCVGSG